MVSLHPSAVDTPAARELLTDYFALRAETFPGGSYRTVFPDPAVFDPPAGVFVVLRDDDDAPMGCGGIRRIPDGPLGVRYEVKHLFLRPETRGRGWGRLLLDDLERRAREWGAGEVVLDTHHSLEAAGGLYARSGFVAIPAYNDNANATRWYGKPLAGAIAHSKRSAGARAGIDRTAIVRAARELAPDGITMQAVADVLGVDRSAVNHHVKSRTQLLKLVAEASFADGFSTDAVPTSADWQEATRHYVRAYVDAVVSTGPLADHLGDGFQQTRFLRATEELLRILGEAGFSDEASVRHLVTIGYIARGVARDRIGLAEGVPRRSTHTQSAIREQDPAAYPNLDRVSAVPFDTYGDAQLAAATEAVIAGAAATLAGRRE